MMDSSIRRLQINDDQAARRKRKMTFLIIFFFLLFATIIGSIISVIIVIEQEAQSEESASNPRDIIRAICNLTPFPTSCLDPIYALLQINTITDADAGERMIKATPSRIFTLSLRAASNELDRVISSNQMAISKVTKYSRIFSPLKSCEGLFRDSSKLLNMSMATMGVEPDDKIFKNATIRSHLKKWISNTRKNMDKCLIGLKDDAEVLKMTKIKVYNAREYVENSSEMLAKMDEILAEFKQQIIIINGIVHNLNDLFHNFGRLVSDYYWLFSFCFQFLYLIALFCFVLRS